MMDNNAFVDDNVAAEILAKVASSMGFCVEKEKGYGWYFLKNCREEIKTDKSRPIQLDMMKRFFGTEKNLLRNFLKSEFIYIPVKYIICGYLSQEEERIPNPFYKLSFWEAAIKVDVLGERV